MASRTGITTDLAARKKWVDTNRAKNGDSVPCWRDYGPYKDKPEAQEARRRLTALYGDIPCEKEDAQSENEKGEKWYAYKYDIPWT